MLNIDKLNVIIKDLDTAYEILKKDYTMWHTSRELKEIKKSMDEIAKFKTELIKKFNL